MYTMSHLTSPWSRTNCNQVPDDCVTRKMYGRSWFRRKRNFLFLSCIAVITYMWVYGVNTNSLQGNINDENAWNERQLDSSNAFLPFEHLESLNNTAPQHVLTLFTTFDISDTFRRQIYINTITMWPQLGPDVRLILFVCGEVTESDPLIQRAKQLQWTIQTTVCQEKLKLPVLRHMFLSAHRIQQSSYYAYSNADMLYDMTLLESLTALKKMVVEEVTTKKIHLLAVGARTMIDVGQNRSINTLDELRTITQNEGKFFTVAGVDYFITTRNDTFWQTIPDFVVSRVAYDSWMVHFHVINDFPTYDLTDTVLAAHQSDGRQAFFSKTVRNASYNLKLTGKRFNWRNGMATCSKYKTRITQDHSEFQIWVRTKKGFCGPGTGVTMNQTHYLLMMKKNEQEELVQSVQLESML